jgi:hypothetical protein
MTELNLFPSAITNNRKVSIAIAAVTIVLIIIALLMTRQLLPYDNNSETAVFLLTVVIGYGFGSWILLGFAKRITTGLRSKSPFINIMNLSVIIIQFSLLGVLLLMINNNLVQCPGYFNLCNQSRLLSTSVYIINTVASSTIMASISLKFFAWYKLSSGNHIILLYALATSTISIAIAVDAGAKLLMVQVVEEKSPNGVVPQASFLYKPDKKYDGQIQYKVINPDTTILYIVPSSTIRLYDLINLIPITLSFIFRWGATSMILRQFYQRIRKLPPTFWIILTIPLILYLVGKIPDIISLPADYPYRFYFRILFRVGTIGGNILFGLAFFMIARKIVSVDRTSAKIKDYLTICAIGITMLISLSVSALQQSYGVASHSLILLSSYLFSVGLYSSAISISQDNSLRQAIRKSTIDLLDNIGKAQMEQELRRKITQLIQINVKKIEEQTGGISTPLTESDIKEYLDQVIEETIRTRKKGHN